jgi:hypothetical protein
MEQVAQRRWVKSGLVIVGLVGFFLLSLLARGCSVEHLGQWTEEAAAKPSPSPRSGQALVYDESGGRVIMFGGSYLASPDGEPGYLGDTWTYDSAAGSWTELKLAGVTPAARFGHVMVYDSDTKTVLMFGGYNDAAETAASSLGLNDLWEYDPAAGTWIELLPSGDRPPGWEHQAMVYDSSSHRLLLLGTSRGPGISSDTSTFVYVNELWAYDRQANAWTKLEQGGKRPPGLAAESLAYDPGTGQVLMVGGYYTSLEGSKPEGEFGLVCNERLWAYDPADNVWVDLKPGGEAPPGLELPYLVYQPTMRRFMLVAQALSTGYEPVTLMYAYDSAANHWTKIVPTDEVYPDMRFLGSAVWCPDQQSIMLYGGYAVEGLGDPEKLNPSYVYPDGEWFYAVPAETG